MDHRAIRQLMSDQDRGDQPSSDGEARCHPRRHPSVHPPLSNGRACTPASNSTTGELTWQQRAWAAVLFAAPAALCAGSALRAANGPGHRDHDDEGAIHVAVDATRTVITPVGVRAHRLVGLESRTQWNRSPPRLRIEEAVTDVAAAARDDFSAIAVLAEAVQSRRTTADRLRRALDARTRIARRDFLAGVLDDVADGACSALEHAYLTRVERPHGLPWAQRQVRASSRGPVYRDVVYQGMNVLVELDGRLDHTRVRDRDRDLDRDLDAALDEQLTVRLGWGQAVDRPCVTAMKMAHVLRQRGWTGIPRRCHLCDVDLEPPGDPKSTLSA
ncbi:MAG: hypothetical protein ABIR34_09350 [Marmoricola sp.]